MSEPLSQASAAFIAAEIARRRLTRRQVATAARIGETLLSKILHRERGVSEETLRALARALGVGTKTLREPPAATGPGRPGVPLWRLVGWFVQRERQRRGLKLHALRRGGGASLDELRAFEAGAAGLPPRSLQEVALALEVPTASQLLCQALLCVAQAPATLQVTWTTAPPQRLVPLYPWGERRDPRQDDGLVALVDAPAEAVGLVRQRDLALRVRGTRARREQLALPLAPGQLVALLVRGAELVDRGIPAGAVAFAGLGLPADAGEPRLCWSRASGLGIDGAGAGAATVRMEYLGPIVWVAGHPPLLSGPTPATA